MSDDAYVSTPIFTDMSVVLRSTKCAGDSLSLFYSTTKIPSSLSRNVHTPGPEGRTWSNALVCSPSPRARASTTPLPDSVCFVSSDSGPRPAGFSSRSRVLIRPGPGPDRSCRAGVDVGVSRFRSLTMMQRTLATLCDRIMLKASSASPPSSVACRTSLARSTKSF